MSQDQLIIVLSGKKQSGKSSTANFIISKFLNLYTFSNSFYLDDQDQIKQFGKADFCISHMPYVVQKFSFADALKEFCVDVLDVPYDSCYGDDDCKNKPLSLSWGSLPKELREKYSKTKGDFLTGRELMQIFGTDICRSLYGDCWVNATFKRISKSNASLAVIQDCRFPNEVEFSIKRNAKVIRLTRSVFKDNHKSETALDEYDPNQYTLCIDNQHISKERQFSIVESHLNVWFKEINI